MTADLIISQLLFLDAEDQEKDIKFFINSPGGSVTAGMLCNSLDYQHSVLDFSGIQSITTFSFNENSGAK